MLNYQLDNIIDLICRETKANSNKCSSRLMEMQVQVISLCDTFKVISLFGKY